MIRLIVGLGNPGKDYEYTRHNVGFLLTTSLAKSKGWAFKEKFLGRVASGIVGEQKVLILQPLTYMNNSGKSIRKIVDYYHIPAQNILVVSDDADLPLGTLRYRQQGSSGGHNGLRSVESHLGTQNYPRLRVGVGNDLKQNLEEYVLDCFTSAELDHLKDVNEEALNILDDWIKGTLGDQTWNIN